MPLLPFYHRHTINNVKTKIQDKEGYRPGPIVRESKLQPLASPSPNSVDTSLYHTDLCQDSPERLSLLRSSPSRSTPHIPSFAIIPFEDPGIIFMVDSVNYRLVDYYHTGCSSRISVHCCFSYLIVSYSNYY